MERLAEAHLVGQDAVDAVIEQPDHPVEPRELVLAHLAELDALGLHRESHGVVLLGGFHQFVIFGIFSLLRPAAALLGVVRLGAREEMREHLGLRHQVLPLAAGVVLEGFGERRVPIGE